MQVLPCSRRGPSPPLGHIHQNYSLLAPSFPMHSSRVLALVVVKGVWRAFVDLGGVRRGGRHAPVAAHVALGGPAAPERCRAITLAWGLFLPLGPFNAPTYCTPSGVSTA